MKSYICPCCGHKVEVEYGDCIAYAVCDNCLWENDPYIKSDDDYSSPNIMSLNEYRKTCNTQVQK